MPLTSEQRDSVVRAAKYWMGTPYHHKAAVKGAGADCAMFPIAVYKECGIIAADYQPPEYSTQWHLHRSEELYLREIERFAVEIFLQPRSVVVVPHDLPHGFVVGPTDNREGIDPSPANRERFGVSEASASSEIQTTPQPADFVVFKFGRTFSHGAIVIKWPLIIHSYIPHGVMLADALTDAQLISREMKVFAVQVP
jgi:cell wall-associated NlpC family hydrolase